MILIFPRYDRIGWAKGLFLTHFWTSASHPGEAIERVLRACARLGIKDALVSELDSCDVTALPAKIVHYKKLNVYHFPERHYFPTENSFRAPFGIIKAFENGKYDYDLIQEGFYLDRAQTGIYEIAVVVEDQKLFSTFIELVKRLASIKLLWIKLAADWEDKGVEQFWTNEKLDTVRRIERFLKDHWSDTIANGHIAITVCSDFGQTNLLSTRTKPSTSSPKTRKCNPEWPPPFRKPRTY